MEKLIISGTYDNLCVYQIYIGKQVLKMYRTRWYGRSQYLVHNNKLRKRSRLQFHDGKTGRVEVQPH